MILQTFGALASLITFFYFVAATCVGAFYGFSPPARLASASRRRVPIACSVVIPLSFLAQGVSYIASTRAPSEAEVVYVYLGTYVYGILAFALLDNKSSSQAHIGARLIGLATESAYTLFRIYMKKDDSEAYSPFEWSQHVIRVVSLSLFVINEWLWMRNDHTKVQDGPTRDNGNNNAAYLVLSRNSVDTEISRGSESDSDVSGYEDDDGFDSESEDPEQDRKLRAARIKRLKESDSWFHFLAGYKIFLPLLFPTRDRFLQLLLSVVVLILAAERILNVLVPRQLGIIADELAAGQDEKIMPWRSVILWMTFHWLNSQAGLGVVKTLAELPIQQFAHKSIGTAAFQHIMGLSMNFHSEKNSGELMRAIEQGQNLQGMLDFFCFEMGPMLLDLLIALVYVYTLFDAYLSMILLTSLTIYVWIGVKTTAMSIAQRRRLNTAWRNESKRQNEAISEWQTVSQFNQGKYESKRFQEAIDEHNSAEWYYYLVYYAGGSAQTAVMLFAQLATHALAAYRVSQGAVPVGNFVTLASYWSSIEHPLSELSWSIRKVSSMLTDAERLWQLLTTKSSVVESEDAVEMVVTEGLVVFENVNFAYDARKPTIKGLSFVAQPGQTVALVGETGSGKSTVLKLLYRYYDIQAGSIRIDGINIRTTTLDSLRNIFGIVPQNPALLNDSISNNIRYGRLDATDQEIEDACRAAVIHDKILTFPDGYNSTVGERGVKLSGGEIQRIAIARAFIRRPKIVLLDEATSSVDLETESHIQQAFGALQKGRTTFVVAHRLSTIQRADVILVISDGQVVEKGTHDELLQLSGRYSQLWSKQSSGVGLVDDEQQSESD